MDSVPAASHLSSYTGENNRFYKVNQLLQVVYPYQKLIYNGRQIKYLSRQSKAEQIHVYHTLQKNKQQAYLKHFYELY